MTLPELSELLGGLVAGITGVVLVVLGLPLCAAIFGRRVARAMRHRSLEGVLVASIVTLLTGVGGAMAWSYAVGSAPGVYDEPLAMLAGTFLPFSLTLAVIALVAQGYSATRRAGAQPRRPQTLAR